ncbi:MAG: hypothetical protein M3R53_06890 [Candidatus Eremiobacteraeota bacterium]|nr:hypothetical protein [Candidatus Eremiobacteraeota bacterium]
MNTDDISFADFLAFNSPPVVKSADPWKLHAYTFVPLGVEAALERIAKVHERAAAAQLRTAKTSTMLLSGATVGQQRAAVRWLTDRLDLPAFVVNAAELCDFAQPTLDELIAPLGEDVPRLFVIRNIDALPAAATARLVARRSRSVFVVATVAEAALCGDSLRMRFRTAVDWRTRARESAQRPFSATLATLLGECFGRF